MMKSLRAKLILCSVCSAALHGLFLEQFIIGQTASNRPISGSSDLRIRYIPSFASLPAVEITSAKLLPTDFGAPSVVKSALPTPNIRNEILESAIPINEFVVVENFYESSEVDEPATPDTDWPIVVEGMTRGLMCRYLSGSAPSVESSGWRCFRSNQKVKKYGTVCRQWWAPR
jgi:hypothetical protein